MPACTFQRRMGRLALAAMLLLLALPTVGRLAAAIAPPADGVVAQLCTVEGLKPVRVDVVAFGVAGDDTGGDASPPHPGDDAAAVDCDYCPLLGGLALARLRGVAWAPIATRRDSPAPRADALRLALLPGGPGSRGPPRSS